VAKRALITGITGQDGSYLAELLLSQGYEVIGLMRRSSTLTIERISHIQERFTLVSGDLVDEVSLDQRVARLSPRRGLQPRGAEFRPDVVDPAGPDRRITALGVTRMLDAIRIVDPEIRFYQASSSEMFGKSKSAPGRATPFYPRSPYGVAKVYGHWITVNYRESYDLHASSGILFNHESPRAVSSSSRAR
jgi:GDPmannose 4,6-dehydratase